MTADPDDARGPLSTIHACLLAIDAEHTKAHDVDGCVMCWPSDGGWPCVTRMETDEALDALQAVFESRDHPEGEHFDRYCNNCHYCWAEEVQP